MSLPLHDLGSVKVAERTHSLFRARALSKRMDVNALARELLDSWAQKELHVMSMAAEIHESKGFGVITSE